MLELIEGETLAERLQARGALPSAEALEISRQIAEALDAAHEKGIIHRAANIKISSEGVVKVLDFGLAKAVVGSDSDNPSHSTRADTREGILLGTAAYTSPEQARGLPVDKRTDIWAFGCVLYEMLTGRAAFGAPTTSDVIARILGGEPDWTALPSDSSQNVTRGLKRCLEKDTKRRLRDLGDLDLALQAAANPSHVRTPKWKLAGLIAGAALSALALALAITRFLRVAPADTLPARFEIPVSTAQPSGFNVSPDGRQIVFLGIGPDRTPRLWLRSLDTLEERPISGTEGEVALNSTVFWSPDGQSIGFYADGRIKKIDSTGGVPQVVCTVRSDVTRDIKTRLTSDSQLESVPAWAADGQALMFAIGHGAGDVYDQPVNGSAASRLFTRTQQAEIRVNPLLTTMSASADGRFLVFTVEAAARAQSDLWVLSRVNKIAAPLVQQDFNQTQGTISPDGRWLAYVSNESAVTEVFLRPLSDGDGSALPKPGAPIPVSRGGATAPRWRGDSGELFYQSLSGGVMAAPISKAGPANAVELFRAPGLSPHWAVTKAGDRFMVSLRRCRSHSKCHRCGWCSTGSLLSVAEARTGAARASSCAEAVMSESRVLVVGATGQLGGAIARKLVASGARVRALARNRDALASFGPAAEIAAVDLRDVATLTVACRGVEQIVATANNNMGKRALSPSRTDLSGYQNLCAAARNTGVRRLIYVSYRGVAQDAPVDIFRIKWYIEDAIRRSGVPHVMLRPTAFMDICIDQIVARSIRDKGIAMIFGDGTCVANYIAVDDVAEFAVKFSGGSRSSTRRSTRAVRRICRKTIWRRSSSGACSPRASAGTSRSRFCAAAAGCPPIQ